VYAAHFWLAPTWWHASTRLSTITWPLQEIRSRRGCCARINHHFIPPRPPALPTLLQYYCTFIGQYKTPLPTSCLYAIHHTVLVITISCEGQTGPAFQHPAPPTPPTITWPLQEIVLLRGFCARIHHSIIASSHLHCPHYCKNYSTSIAQYTTPPRPPLCMPYTTQYW